MRTIGVHSVVFLIAVSLSCAGAAAPVRLAPDQRMLLHIGELGALHAPLHERLVGSAGGSLVLVGHVQHAGATIYLYRAARAGYQQF